MAQGVECGGHVHVRRRPSARYANLGLSGQTASGASPITISTRSTARTDPGPDVTPTRVHHCSASRGPIWIRQRTVPKAAGGRPQPGLARPNSPQPFSLLGALLTRCRKSLTFEALRGAGNAAIRLPSTSEAKRLVRQLCEGWASTHAIPSGPSRLPSGRRRPVGLRATATRGATRTSRCVALTPGPRRGESGQPELCPSSSSH